MKMSNFSQSDWDCFSGCDSEYPKIGEIDLNGSDECFIIQDGEYCHIESMNVFAWRKFESENDAIRFCQLLPSKIKMTIDQFCLMFGFEGI